MDDPVTMRAGAVAPPRAYQFDEVFALDAEEPVAASQRDGSKSREAIEAAHNEGYLQGLEEGRRVAAKESAALLSESVARLAEGVRAATERAVTQRRELEHEAIRLGLAAARKLATALIAREPGAEIEALLRNLLGELRDAPHLVIRIIPDHAEDLRERLATVARESGFTGHVAVLADPDIAPGDGRIDWADGGVIRCRAAIEQALDEAVARYFAASERTEADKDGSNG